jgi:hypothetical protein
MPITNPAVCEVRSVIRFSNWKIIRPSEICRKLVEVYGEGVMNGGNVCERDEDARVSSPRISKTRVDAHVFENRRFTIDEHLEVLLLRYRNVCARWVPRMLTDEHKQKKRKKQLRIG